MYRHGDLIIIPIQTLPEHCTQQQHLVLAHGEVTGHKHQIAEKDAAELYRLAGEFFLKVTADTATLVHEEHHAIPLPQGIYQVRHQREYSPEAIRRVVD